MNKRIKMMAIVRKYYDIDPNDREALRASQKDFDKQKVGDLAFHYFPLEDEVEL